MSNVLTDEQLSQLAEDFDGRLHVPPNSWDEWLEMVKSIVTEAFRRAAPTGGDTEFTATQSYPNDLASHRNEIGQQVQPALSVDPGVAERGDEMLAYYDLLPCPFCGGPPYVSTRPRKKTTQIRCSNCQFGLSTAEKWNRRPAPPTDQGASPAEPAAVDPGVAQSDPDALLNIEFIDGLAENCGPVFVASFKLRTDNTGYYALTSEQLPGFFLGGRNADGLLTDALPAWRMLHSLAPGQVIEPPKAPIPSPPTDNAALIADLKGLSIACEQYLHNDYAAIVTRTILVISSAGAREQELERQIKNLAPIGKYNGHDIEYWYRQAQDLKAQMARQEPCELSNRDAAIEVRDQRIFELQNILTWFVGYCGKMEGAKAAVVRAETLLAKLAKIEGGSHE